MKLQRFLYITVYWWGYHELPKRVVDNDNTRTYDVWVLCLCGLD